MRTFRMLKLENLKLLFLTIKYFKNWQNIIVSIMKNNKRVTIVYRKTRDLIECDFIVFHFILDLLSKNELLDFKVRDSGFLLDHKWYPADFTRFFDEFYAIRLINKGWHIKDAMATSPDGVKFVHGNLRIIYETFEELTYDIDCKDREILDIGANVGDTAIFFARKGAKKIHAFEPVTMAYQVAKRNLELNGITNVDLFNSPVTSDKFNLVFPSVSDLIRSTYASPIGEKTVASNTVVLEGTPLYEIMKNIQDPYLLKIDCEGCEFDLIRNSYPEIRKFQKVIFECHPALSGEPCKELLKVLRRDFDIDFRKSGGIPLVECTKRVNNSEL